MAARVDTLAPTGHTSTDSKELQMVTAAVILSFVISIVLVLVAISQIDA